MNHCPIVGCDTLIHPDTLLCPTDWMRLPQFARDDLTMLRRSEPDSDLCRRTIAVTLAYLNDLATTREQVAG